MRHLIILLICAAAVIAQSLRFIVTDSFDPSAIAGLQLHLDASRIAGLSEGEAVAAWSDLSPNGFSAVQATEGNRPTYHLGVLNGKPVVRFARASSHYLVINNHAALQLRNPCTIVAVAVDRGDAAYARIVWKGGSYGLGTYSTTRQAFFTVLGGADHIAYGSLFTQGEPHIVSVRFGADYDPKIFFDGNAAAHPTGSVDIATSTAALIIGGYPTTQYWDGDIAEVLFYNRELSRAELDRLHKYLGDKWGVTAGKLDAWEASATNAPTYQTIPTYDESGQGIHPSLVYAPEGWNGYKYWLAHSLYTDSQASLENPCVVASNDGETWVLPPGASNPIVDTPDGGYNADPELFFSADGTTLYLINRQIIGTAESLYLLSSTDGVTWTTQGPENLILSSNNTNDIISPSVLWDGEQYVMWATRTSTNKIERRTAVDPFGPWSEPVETNALSSSNRHTGVVKDGGVYRMVVGPDIGSEYHYSVSYDGLTWFNARITGLNLGGAGTWDESQLYRAEPLMLGGRLHLWYSAKNAAGEWHIGHTVVTISR